jgi:GH24 family phage-related lysozyme (muramidase)
MTTSADLIARFEGYRSSPYWDVNAYRAGFGSDTTTLPDGRVVPIRQGMQVTRDDSLRDLDRRISTEFQPSAMRAVGQDVWSALSPQQQAVLNSLAYNYGAGAWDKGLSGVVAAVRSPGMDDDIAAIRALASHNDGINRNRRLEEATIYGSNALADTPQEPTTNALAPREQQDRRPDFRMVDMRLDPRAFMTSRRNALAPLPFEYRRNA